MQYPFVADNTESLAEAYLAISSGEAYAYPFAVYDDETLVGFVMIGYNEAAIEEDPPESSKDNYSLWRLMIDKNYQRRGFGREAVRPCVLRWSSSGRGRMEGRNTAKPPTIPRARSRKSCTRPSASWKTAKWTMTRSSPCSSCRNTIHGRLREGLRKEAPPSMRLYETVVR